MKEARHTSNILTSRKRRTILPTGPAWTNNSHSSSSETYQIIENYQHWCMHVIILNNWRYQIYGCTLHKHITSSRVYFFNKKELKSSVGSWRTSHASYFRLITQGTYPDRTMNHRQHCQGKKRVKFEQPYSFWISDITNRQYIVHLGFRGLEICFKFSWHIMRPRKMCPICKTTLSSAHHSWIALLTPTDPILGQGCAEGNFD
jgi:hypothetical protein